MKALPMQRQNPRPNGLNKERLVVKKSQKNRLPFRAVVQFAMPTVALLMLGCFGALRAEPGQDNRGPDLSTNCASIAVPVGNKVASHAYAVGVQIYRWSGTNWAFVAPAAVLYADADYDGEVGTHFAGPTWESNSGSKVVGARVAGCTADPTAIPWLLLQAATSEGPGVFHRVTYIQRVNTVGGLAPATVGNTVGQEAQVPYTAEYFFYRAAIE
jgi:hypothetical protein